jgi:hypothetical protein
LTQIPGLSNFVASITGALSSFFPDLLPPNPCHPA